MSFSHPYGTYSVQGTLNRWLETNLTAKGIPTWMTTARVVFDYPRESLFGGSGWAFSVTHFDADPVGAYQGRHVGEGEVGTPMQGMMEVSCWASRQHASGAAPQWIRQMGDMVSHLFASAVNVPLTDLYTDPAGASGLTALVRVQPARHAPVVPDVNPDVVRRRYLVNYSWIERVSGA